MKRVSILLAGLVLAAATPGFAQGMIPGTADIGRVAAGTYKVDPAHSQITFTVNHIGFSNYRGIFGGITGSMTIDPRDPAKATVSIEIPIKQVVTTVTDLTKHLLTPDFFDAAKHPTAHFESTSIEPSGTKAKIHGKLTIRGITRPVVLDATLVGAGSMMGKPTVGFDATTRIKRSDFNVLAGIPMVPDEVPLEIAVAFEKAN